MECQYCKKYESARLREEREKEQWRHCKELGKWVTADTKWCQEFELTRFFFCIKNNNRLAVEVCVDRQQKEKCKCKQGRKIMEMKKGLVQGKRRGATPKIENKLIRRRSDI